MAPYCITNIRPPDFIFAESWREAIEALHFGLAEIGIAAPIFENRIQPGATPILFGAHHLAEGQEDQLPGETILYNFEQLTPGYPWHTQRYLSMLSRFCVWDNHSRNVEYLGARGTSAARLVPVGYVPQLTRIRSGHEDIDVLFYGILSERRQKILSSLTRRGLNVVALNGVFGRERDQWIARAKLVINLHHSDGGQFESLRVLYLLANRKPVVSEMNVSDEIDPELQRGLCAKRYDQLVDACVELAHDAQKRKCLAEAGFQTVTLAHRRMSAILRQVPNLA